MKKDIIFYAPLGKSLPPDKIGGMEQGCRKTVEILRDAGFHVILVEKPVKGRSMVAYLLRILAAWIRLLILLISRREAVLHVSGCYRELVYVEWRFISSAKFLKHQTVYEIRNGGMIQEYEKRGGIYRRAMSSLLRHSDYILSQGSDYLRFIEEKFGKSSLYYPNYIQDRFLTGYPLRTTTQCRLVYFGRIVPAKNIDVMVDICRILHSRELKATLDLIGGCSDSYKAELKDEIRKSGIPDNSIRFWGRREFEAFFPYLKSCHFFLFPSNEPREGHSNSLTEAMGCGIVPIVSDAGFNRQVVDDDKLVISEADNAVMYANVIFEIWTSGEWKPYSCKMYSRVAENFTESCVRETLLEAYQ